MSKEVKCRCGRTVAILESGSKWQTGASVLCRDCTNKKREKDKEFMNTELGKIFGGFK